MTGRKNLSFRNTLLLMLIAGLLAPSVRAEKMITRFSSVTVISLTPVAEKFLEPPEQSDEGARALCAEIINYYHSLGYTENSILKIQNLSGVLTITVKEPLLSAVKVHGAGDEDTQIRDFIAEGGPGIFNETALARKAAQAKKRFALKSIALSKSYTASGDIILNVSVEKDSVSFSMGLDADYFYGIRPGARLLYSGGNFLTATAFDLSVRESGLRASSLSADISTTPGASSVFFFGGVKGAYSVDRIAASGADYSSMLAVPRAGAGFKTGPAALSLFADTRSGSLSNYGNYSGSVHNPALNMSVLLTDRDRLINLRESSFAELVISGGWENLEGGWTASGSLSAEKGYYPLPQLCLTAGLHFFATSSGERFFHRYVHTEKVRGFKSYESSGLFGIISIDLDWEIIPLFLYAGPLADAVIYKNEKGGAENTECAGISVKAFYGLHFIGIYYSGDLKNYAEFGNIGINISARF